ncbi:MAG: GAF domain-containing protein, partial [Pseudobacter sp.]|uniref:GAF domain-containing protein n=1 Tax=Pseudobacter sp. TaxID=2045420 RepID=UPI003F7F3B27
MLLLLDRSFEKIIQVSENISGLVNLGHREVAGAKALNIFTQEAVDLIRQAVKDTIDGKLPLVLPILVNGVAEKVFCLIHVVEEGFVIEAELRKFYSNPPQSFLDIYQRIKYISQYINLADSLQEVCEVTVREMKKWTGFDKIMIYRFDENWNGTVLAEEAEEGMELYMGLTFPASDIPKPAREMYLKNAYRLIPNREYEPVKIYPLLNPVSNSFTNLLNADLRSVASVHIEYLKNMQVKASMSARIQYQGKLWGLIACHHREAKYLSFEECSVVEMISNMLSQKITSLQNEETVSLKQELTRQFADIVEKIAVTNSIVEAFADNAALLTSFLRAEGIALSWEGQIETDGITPSEGDIEVLVYWLRQKARQQTYHEHQLPAVFEESHTFADKASGIIALPVQPDRGNYLIAFRPELIKTISWGGNPDDAVQFEPNSTVYHPRHSFKVWQQTVHHTAQNWHPEEIAAAERLRNFLVQHTL